MNVIETKIEGLLILEPRVFGDDRGWFSTDPATEPGGVVATVGGIGNQAGCRAADGLLGLPIAGA